MMFGSTVLLAQDAIVQQEVELEILLDSLRAAKNDASKNNWNAQFKKQLEQTLNEPTALTYTFSRLKTIGIINSPDNLVRIVSWNVEQDDQSQRYFAYVLKGDERKPEHKVIELVDNSFMLPARTDDVLEADNWYGALYYKIIPVDKNNKTYYTLLGWDGNTSSSNIKLIDVLYFSGNTLKLGAPLFKWLLVEDVIGVNKDEEMITVKSINPRTEEIMETEVANKWVDPTTEGSPASKEVHVAVTPDTESELAAASEKEAKTKKNKDPQNAMDAYDAKKGRKKEKGTSVSFDTEKKIKKPKKSKKK
jgi:hypothetical protein